MQAPKISFKKNGLIGCLIFVLQLPAGGVGGPAGDASSLYAGHHEELQLSRSSAGQQQRLRFVPAAVC